MAKTVIPIARAIPQPIMEELIASSATFEGVGIASSACRVVKPRAIDKVMTSKPFIGTPLCQSPNLLSRNLTLNRI